jgi:hypothetical protein
MTIIKYNKQERNDHHQVRNKKKETTITKANALEVGDNQGKQLK